MKKCMVMTGGGTAGHVTPNLALIPLLQKHGWNMFYIGTQTGIESDLLSKTSIPYYSISAGKLRRYFSVENFIDPFKIGYGVLQSLRLLRRLRPKVVFSKGGFVGVPVAVAARFLSIPVILHESDASLGLANRLVLPFVSHICLAFPELLSVVPKHKATVTGNPIRTELFTGQRDTGLEICEFSGRKPILLVMGGSLGSVALNGLVRQNLPRLRAKFDIVHLCGRGHRDEQLESQSGYIQFEYVDKELPHLLAASELVVTRAGANALFELAALAKPALYVPLPRATSRGDQIDNAASFSQRGFGQTVNEEDLARDKNRLVTEIQSLYTQREKIKRRLVKTASANANESIVEIITRFAQSDA